MLSQEEVQLMAAAEGIPTGKQVEHNIMEYLKQLFHSNAVYVTSSQIMNAVHIDSDHLCSQPHKFGSLVKMAGWYPVGQSLDTTHKGRVYVPVSYNFEEARAQLKGVIRVNYTSMHIAESQRIVAQDKFEEYQRQQETNDFIDRARKENRITPDNKYILVANDDINNDAKHSQQLKEAMNPGEKRKRGRPKGSKNKLKRVELAKLINQSSTSAMPKLADVVSAAERTVQALQTGDEEIVEAITNKMAASKSVKETLEVLTKPQDVSTTPVILHSSRDHNTAQDTVVHIIHELRDVVSCLSMERIRKLFIRQVSDDAWDNLQVRIIDNLEALDWVAEPLQAPDGRYVLCMTWPGEREELDDDDSNDDNNADDEVADG